MKEVFEIRDAIKQAINDYSSKYKGRLIEGNEFIIEYGDTHNPENGFICKFGAGPYTMEVAISDGTLIISFMSGLHTYDDAKGSKSYKSLKYRLNYARRKPRYDIADPTMIDKLMFEVDYFVMATKEMLIKDALMATIGWKED